MNNCIDCECKYISYDVTHDDYFCNKQNIFVPDDIDKTGCPYFVQARNCLSCIHSRDIVYETGVIDCIDYHCPFQEGKDKHRGKMIYSDQSPYVSHHFDIPECTCNKFEPISELI